MASVNKVILVGNCGRDPEIRYLPSGQAVANVSLATSSKRKDKNTGETVEDTQWHRVTFYDRLAEIAGEYVKKGRPDLCRGPPEIRQVHRQGRRREEHRGHHRHRDAAARRPRRHGRPVRRRRRGRRRAARAAPAHAPGAPAAQRPAAAKPSTGFDDMDDDIPF